MVIEGKESSEDDSSEKDVVSNLVSTFFLSFLSFLSVLYFDFSSSVPPSTPFTTSAKAKQHSKQFTGRGAQFMNILRRKQDNGGQISSPISMDTPSTKSDPFNSPRVQTTPGPETPSSILKRKFLDCSFQDVTPEHKKKRVSFHDPPVSAMKEFTIEPIET